MISKKQSAIIFYCILAIALVLRVIRIGSREIWYDDAFSYFLSIRSLPEIISGTAADTMPPLYYFLLHFWIKIGSSIAFLRFLNVFISLGIIVFAYDLVRKALNPAAGLWSAFILAISPLFIYHAQELRMYSILVLGQVGYYWCFWQFFFEKPGRRAGKWLVVGMVFFGAISMYSHNLAVFGLAVSNVFLLLMRDFRKFVDLLKIQIFILVLSLPWLLMIPGQVQKIQAAFWTPQPGILEVLQAYLQFTLYLPVTGWRLTVGAVVGLQILIILILELFKQRREFSKGLYLFIVLAVFPPILLFVISYLMRPVFVPRGFLISVVGFAGIAGYIISRSSQKGLGYLVAGMLIVSAAISLPDFYTKVEFPRSAYKDMTLELEKIIKPDEIVLHDNKLSYFPSLYYSPNLNQLFLPDEPGSHNDTFAPQSQKAMQIFPAFNVILATESQDGVYFVVFEKAIQEYREMGFSQHPVIEQLETEFIWVKTLDFSDLRVYYFTR